MIAEVHIPEQEVVVCLFYFEIKFTNQILISFLDEDICSTNSSTSNSSLNIPNRLKNRDLIIQEKLIPLPPQKTRSKMHDLAVKHRLITNQVIL